MTGLRIVVAAYGALSAAQADWNGLDAAVSIGGSHLIDAVMIERSSREVERCVAASKVGLGHGVLASAAFAALWPAALVSGALAGAVGGHVMTAVTMGLARDAVEELGWIFESGRYVILGVADQQGACSLAELSPRSVRSGSRPMACTTQLIRIALAADAADDLA